MDKSLSTRIERMQQKAAEIEANAILQLPLWPEAKRGTPNTFLRSALFSAIQGKDRNYLEGKKLASQDGFTVTYTGQQLNQEDLTLWETLVHLARETPLGNICNFTAHGILKALGLSVGGDEHKRLHRSITRLQACSVQITYNPERKTYFGPLVKAGVKDELTKHYAVELNRELIRLYGETQWTALDWAQRKALRRKPLAQALHGYYSSHTVPYVVTLAFLQRITGSKNQQKAGFKAKLRAALGELVDIGFLSAFAIDGDRVSVQRQISSALAAPR